MPLAAASWSSARLAGPITSSERKTDQQIGKEKTYGKELGKKGRHFPLRAGVHTWTQLVEKKKL